MSVSRGNWQEVIRQVRDRESSARLDESHDEKANLISILMVELSVCFQMILTDVAQTSDLEEVGRRWVERLRSLATFIESSLSVYETKDGQDQSRDALSSVTASADLPGIVSKTHSRIESKSSSGLTLREFEILNLSEKGFPPRKIAARLQLSVQTVYTHLRNIRSKQRKLI